jgi:hypothetical protein
MQREVGGKAEHIERTKTSQSDIGLENKHKKTHFKWGDDTKPIQFKNLASIPKPGKMFESTKDIIPNMKTKKDLMSVLSTANPKGFVMVIDNSGKGELINNPATLNVSSYGYKNSEGIDITEGRSEKDFVALPGYDQVGVSNEQYEHGDVTLSDLGGAHRRGRSEVYRNKAFADVLNSHQDDAILVSFDGHLISDIRLNGNELIYILDDWGNKHHMNKKQSKPNDFVILTKGEELDRFFRPERAEAKLNEEIKRSKKIIDFK